MIALATGEEKQLAEVGIKHVDPAERVFEIGG
jgi:hypothetical protein